MNINPFLFNSIINAKAKHLGRNHQFIYCQLPDGKTIKAYALTHVSSANVNVVKFEGNYYCFCGSAPVELSRSTKQLGVRVKRQKKEQSLLFLLIDITKSLENDGVLQAINYINTHNYQFYQYLSFGDTTGYISEPLSKTDILTELQDYYDNYNGNYDDDFYCSEGTDLPENGIDALNDAILSIDNKYLVDLYLVTDNSKYSRNTSDPEDILDLIDNKINKLFIDIIEPKNVPSEHIIEQGSETNPYCSNSAITTVLVNDVKIGNYPILSSIINKIDNYKLFVINYKGFKVYKYVLKLIQHFVDNTNISFTRCYSPETPTSELFESIINGVTHIRSSNTLWVRYGYWSWNENENPPNDLPTNEVMNNFLNSNRNSLSVYSYANSLATFSEYAISYSFEVISKTEIASFDVSHLFLFGTSPVCDNLTLYDSYPAKHKYQLIYRNQIKEDLNFDCISLNEFLKFDDAFLINFNKSKLNYTNSGNSVSIFYDNTMWYDQVYNDCTAEILEFESDKKTLKINNNFDIELQQFDIVKAICQPQIVPLIEPNSTLYTTSLPPSNKIIYLD